MSLSTSRRLRLYMLETKYEYLKQIRLRAYVIFTLGFPVMFYVLFGLMFVRRSVANGESFAEDYLATYGAFSVITAALFGLGVGVAAERGQGWMLLKRASPMPIEAYFLAKGLVNVLSAATIVAILSACGVAFLGLRIPVTVWFRLAAILVVGGIPFCALGLAIGYWAGPNSAVGVANLINMPMAILSGLWIPINFLPAGVRGIAPWLPSYHFGQLALGVLGADRGGSVLGHVLALVGFAGACLALAYVGYRRDEDKTYG